MKRFEYKGYIINVTEHQKKSQPYYAEVNGEGHWSTSEEGAVNLVKNYIDALPTLREMSFQPMKQYEIDAVKNTLKNEKRTIFLRRQLIKSHYITHNSNGYIEPEFLYFHYDELQKLLLDEEGYSVNLKSDEYLIGTRSCFFVYDADFYKTERDVFELKQTLYRKQLEEE